MKAVYMLMHQKKPNTQALVSRVFTAFSQAGILIGAEQWLRELPDVRDKGWFVERNPEECDAVIAVGGDGTLLRANALAMRFGLPVFGINVGRVGFLTEIEMDELESACAKLATDEYVIEERMMLEAQLGDQKATALNDIVISRGGYSRLIALDATVNNEMIGHFIADGLIISTPTGSTGYSLSAGGPLVYPELECMLITPVCAHSLQHRPVVTSARQTIAVSLEPERSASISVDGQEPFCLNGGQKLLIRRAEQNARFVRLETGSFFEKIRIKLAEWSC